MSIKDNTRIARSFTVNDWKELREKLPIDNDVNNKNWHKAFKVFSLRVKSRFLNPIDAILKLYPRKGKGEGFSAVALQCILIEFFEAFYEGKIYRPNLDKKALKLKSEKLDVKVKELKKFVQPNEYSSSASLFKNFLNREPFKGNTPNIWKDFFSNFRCGLLHEAATKDSAIIRTKKKVGDNTLIEKEEGNIILYRTPFQRELKKYLKTYEKELLSSPELKKAFIRKMDDICQIKRIYYFAYGSNLNERQMNERKVTIYETQQGFINNYKLKFNKESIDGSSKANIIKSNDEKVWGICYELDTNGFNSLKRCEKGYDEQDVIVYNEKQEILFIAKTFVSNKIWDKLPNKEYLDKIITGAKQYELPKDYIDTLEKQLICLEV